MKRFGVDSVQSWIIVVACLLIYLFVSGAQSGFDAIIFVALIQENGITREDASWPFNIAEGTMIFIGPITGYLMSRFSTRTISLLGVLLFSLGCAVCFFHTNIIFVSFFFGLMKGSGLIMTFTVTLGMLITQFEKNQTLALGIAILGNPIGSVMFPKLAQHCLEEYGLKGTFLILGGIALHGAIGCVILTDYSDRKLKVSEIEDPKEPVTVITIVNRHGSIIRTPSETVFKNAKQSDKGHQAFDRIILKKIFTSWGFYIVTFTQLVLISMFVLYFLLIWDYAGDKGVSYDQSVYLVPVISAGNIVGQTVLGWIADRQYVSKQTFLVFLLLMSSMFNFIAPVVETFEMMALCAVLYGMVLGVSFSLSTILFAGFFEKREISMAVSMCHCLSGIAALCRSSIIGAFRDVGGSYDNLFRLGGAICTLTSFTWMFEIWRQGRIRKNNQMQANKATRSIK